MVLNDPMVTVEVLPNYNHVRALQGPLTRLYVQSYIVL